jgi:hypothetical protein
MSPTQPGIVFTINDSGNGPFLYALDTTGADRGRWRVEGVRNADWEAAAAGPCVTGRPPANARYAASCLYIGDVGDNSASRDTRDIIRVAEPVAMRARDTGRVASERFAFRYADGPHDVEAMYVGPDGTIYLITKRPLDDAARRLRPALVFTLRAGAWDEESLPVARLTDSLPIVLGSAPLRVVTDAALSPDARYLAVRTYAQVYVFAADSATGRVRGDVPPATCNIVGVEEVPGEGITWYDGTTSLLLTHEGRDAAMHVVDCPLPVLR